MGFSLFFSSAFCVKILGETKKSFGRPPQCGAHTPIKVFLKPSPGARFPSDRYPHLPRQNPFIAISRVMPGPDIDHHDCPIRPVCPDATFGNATS